MKEQSCVFPVNLEKVSFEKAFLHGNKLLLSRSLTWNEFWMMFWFLQELKFTTHSTENNWGSHSKNHPRHQTQSQQYEVWFTQHIPSQNSTDPVGYILMNLSWKIRHKFKKNCYQRKKLFTLQRNKKQTPPNKARAAIILRIPKLQFAAQ